MLFVFVFFFFFFFFGRGLFVLFGFVLNFYQQIMKFLFEKDFEQRVTSGYLKRNTINFKKKNVSNFSVFRLNFSFENIFQMKHLTSIIFTTLKMVRKKKPKRWHISIFKISVYFVFFPYVHTHTHICIHIYLYIYRHVYTPTYTHTHIYAYSYI